jgi:hypothetical protein
MTDDIEHRQRPEFVVFPAEKTQNLKECDEYKPKRGMYRSTVLMCASLWRFLSLCPTTPTTLRRCEASLIWKKRLCGYIFCFVFRSVY